MNNLLLNVLSYRIPVCLIAEIILDIIVLKILITYTGNLKII